MEREKTRQVTIEGRTYRMDKVTALTGSNLIRKFAAMPGDKPLAAFISSMTDDEYASLQRTCLFVVSEITEGGKPAPVMMADGRLTIDVLPDTIYALTFGSLLFQLESFFGENALQEFINQIQSSTPAGA
jgi:hypothetical protein